MTTAITSAILSAPTADAENLGNTWVSAISVSRGADGNRRRKPKDSAGLRNNGSKKLGGPLFFFSHKKIYTPCFFCHILLKPRCFLGFQRQHPLLTFCCHY
jgi:hypothetical protein